MLVSETTPVARRARASRRSLAARPRAQHRLKDLSAPQRLFQLGEEEFPPLASLYQTNLPVPATPFLGRERELQEVSALLADEGHPAADADRGGGLGQDAARRPGGRRRRRALPGRRLLGRARLPAGAGARHARRSRRCWGRRRSWPSTSARSGCCSCSTTSSIFWARRLSWRSSSPPARSSTLLVTSREALHLTGEREYAVLPLREADAVSLFHERVRATGVELTTNGEIDEDLPSARPPAARDRARRRAGQGAPARAHCSSGSSSGCRS